MTLIAATTSSISFYVAANTSAGLSESIEIINISPIDSTKSYTADIQVPIGATVSSLKLSWTATNISYVKKSQTTSTTSSYVYRSGNVSIHAVGSKLTVYLYSSAGYLTSVTFTTKQAQITVPALKFFIPSNKEAKINGDFYAAETKNSSTSYKEEFKYLPGGGADYSKAKLC